MHAGQQGGTAVSVLMKIIGIRVLASFLVPILLDAVRCECFNIAGLLLNALSLAGLFNTVIVFGMTVIVVELLTKLWVAEN